MNIRRRIIGVALVIMMVLLPTVASSSVPKQQAEEETLAGAIRALHTKIEGTMGEKELMSIFEEIGTLDERFPLDTMDVDAEAEFEELIRKAQVHFEL